MANDHMDPVNDIHEVIGAAEFKAHFLEILDRLSARKISRVTVTKRGRPVAILLPPENTREAVQRIHPLMRGSVIIPPGTELTAPTIEGQFDAAGGRLHR